MSDIKFLPISSNIISTDTGSALRFTLTNFSDSSVSVYWIDRSGNEILYTTLGKNESYTQPTSSSHAWELRSDDGKIAYKFLPESPGVITIGTDYALSFMDASEKVFQTLDGLWSTAQGYGLIDVAKSLGIADVGDLPLNGQNNNLALNAINAPAAWAAGITGKNVKVAVVDSGIAANAEINKNIVGGYDFQDHDANPTPNNGTYRDHALGVASIIAASHDAHAGRDTMGVAPDAQLLNVRVGDSNTGSTSTAMASGIRWAVDNGAKVICMPLQNDWPGASQELFEAVHYAYQHNVVTVIIGGNYSNYGPTGPATIAQQLKGEVIDVGNFNVMAAQPFGSSNMPGMNPFPWVMASSSGYVPNGDGGYTYWQDGGTSFAGPYVAGLAALLWQQNPNATAAEIIGKILSGATLGASEALAAASAGPVVGTAKGDLLKAAAGAAVDGGAGVDTLQFTGASTDYVINPSSLGFSVTTKSDHSVNLLTNVERLSFSDKSIALDIYGNGGEVYRLYQAAFNRAPDKEGLGFWMHAMDNGTSLATVADGFAKSGEFQKLYGANPGNEQLITAMYQNVLHRAPEADGLSFWLDAMKHGTTVVSLLTSFSESPENQLAMSKIIGQGFEYIPMHV
jgi:subtilisin family serine protease